MPRWRTFFSGDDNEGIEAVKEFIKNSISPFGPLQDAEQAIKTNIDNAVAWDIDTAKVGMMGFSNVVHVPSRA